MLDTDRLSGGAPYFFAVIRVKTALRASRHLIRDDEHAAPCGTARIFSGILREERVPRRIFIPITGTEIASRS